MAKNPLPMLTLFLGSMSIVLYQCRTQAAAQLNHLNAVAERQLGNDYAITYNTSHDLALCQEGSGKGHIGKKYKFMVVRLHDGKILYKGTYKLGYVKWLDNESLEIYRGERTATDEPAQSAKEIVKINLKDK
jgi:hypothetical protein